MFLTEDRGGAPYLGMEFEDISLVPNEKWAVPDSWIR